jgi:hypothetical protein
MSTKASSFVSRLRLSLDWWAVLAAFAIAAVVRLGIVKRVPW